MPVSRDLPRYVERVRAKGHDYYWLRLNGRRVRRLHATPGTPEFWSEYAAALAIFRAPSPKRETFEEGTLGWLIAEYKRSSYYTSKGAKTRISYDRELARLAPIRAFRAEDIRRRHINVIRDGLAATPRTQQLFGQVCSLLFAWGIEERELEMTNPAARMSRDGEARSYVPWTEAQMAQFEASLPPRHLLAAYMVARYTGPRRADITGLKRSHDDGKGLTIAGSKTSNPVWVPTHPDLRAYLDALPPALTLIADEAGRPVTPDRLTHDMRAWLDGIGLEGLHLHGLRHTAGKTLADLGCTMHEIAAVLGHKTMQMVQRYTKGADQKRLATAAILKMTSAGGKRD